MNTTSTGLLWSSAFFSAFPPSATVLVGTEFVAGSDALPFGLTTRVVTLAMGAAITLVRVRVSMVAFTDMPGRKSLVSVMRMRTWNCVADWPDDEELLL